MSSAGIDVLVLGNVNFAGITGTVIAAIGGSTGNVAQAVSAPHQLVHVRGAGPDLFSTAATTAISPGLPEARSPSLFVGGAGGDLLTGGDGDDTFSFTAATLGWRPGGWAAALGRLG